MTYRDAIASKNNVGQNGRVEKFQYVVFRSIVQDITYILFYFYMEANERRMDAIVPCGVTAQNPATNKPTEPCNYLCLLILLPSFIVENLSEWLRFPKMNLGI